MFGTKARTEAAGSSVNLGGRRAFLSAVKVYRKECWSGRK